MEEIGILIMGGYLGKKFGKICKFESMHLLQPKNSTLFLLSGGSNYKILTFWIWNVRCYNFSVLLCFLYTCILRYRCIRGTDLFRNLVYSLVASKWRFVPVKIIGLKYFSLLFFSLTLAKSSVQVLYYNEGLTVLVKDLRKWNKKEKKTIKGHQKSLQVH